MRGTTSNMTDTFDKNELGEPTIRSVVNIYTDGSCNGNTDRGGWAYVMTRDGVTEEDSGAISWTTNNRMELQAAIKALSVLKEPSEVSITSDARYMVDGMNQWIRAWKAAGWYRAGGKPVANRDQWETLDQLCQRHHVTWIWVAGHSGNPGNERCDYLANQEAGVEEVAEWWRHRPRPDGKRKSLESRRRDAGILMKPNIFTVIDECCGGESMG
jgi:ribonuclease HI